MKVSCVFFLLDYVIVAWGLTHTWNFNAVPVSSEFQDTRLEHVTAKGKATSISCAITCALRGDCVGYEHDVSSQQCVSLTKISDATHGGTLFLNSNWKDDSCTLKWVSVGLAGIFGIHTNGSLLYMFGSFNNAHCNGCKWHAMPAEISLENLDVGKTSLWGTDLNGVIFCRANIAGDQPSGDHWIQVDGVAHQATVNDVDNSVWVINEFDQLFYRDGVEDVPCGSGWSYASESVKYVDAGPAGLWIITTSLEVAYSESGDPLSLQIIGQDYVMVASGSGGQVCAVPNAGGPVQCRSDGYDSSEPWKDLQSAIEPLDHISMFWRCQLIGLSTSGALHVLNTCL